MGPYWASSTARLTSCGPRWTSVHGPWTYGRAHGGPSPPSLLLGSAHVHRAYARVAGEGGCSPVSYRGGAPAGGELTVSPRGGAGVRLGRGKASLGHGDCVSGVKVAARASPRCWPRRAAARAPPACGNGARLWHRPVLWCAWATQRPNGHVGQVEGSSRAFGGFGHGGALPSSTAVSVRCLRSW